MRNFGNFILVELFSFRFERSLPRDFGRDRSILEVYQIWKKWIQRNQSYEDMKFHQTANDKNPYENCLSSKTSFSYNSALLYHRAKWGEI